ncbi:MAG: lysylphosphatidylglycerol synthase transmembrane domain-containing protein [Oscillospiraceae bacterium]
MQKKQKKNNHMLGQIFLLCLIALTFYVIFKNNSLSEILRALNGLNPVYIAIAVAMIFLSILFQALALGEPFRDFGHNISLKRKLDYAFAGFFFSAVTPSSTGGQPMQIFYMCRDNLHLSHVSVSMLLANITYQTTLVLYGISMYLLKFNLINEKLQGFISLLIFGLFLNLLFALVILFMLCSKKFAKNFANGVVTLMCKMHILKDEKSARVYILKQINEYSCCARIIRTKPMLLIKVFAFTILQMGTLYAIPFFVYKAFGLSGGSFFDLLALQAVLYVAVSFLPLPGAVGASESGFVKLFLVFFTEATIVPAMLVSRGISFYLMLVVSGIAVFVMQLRKPDAPRKRRVMLLRHISYGNLKHTA